MGLLEVGFYSVRKSRHHFRFKRLPGSPGMLRVDKFEIRGLRWLERFERRDFEVILLVGIFIREEA